MSDREPLYAAVALDTVGDASMSNSPMLRMIVDATVARERADVLAQLQQSIDGAGAIAKRHKATSVKPGVDITVYVARLKALQKTIEAGCHEGLAK